MGAIRALYFGSAFSPVEGLLFQFGNDTLESDLSHGSVSTAGAGPGLQNQRRVG